MPSPTVRPAARLLVMSLLCAALVGCQAITALPGPSTVAQASSASGGASPAPSAAGASAATTAAPSAVSPAPSASVATTAAPEPATTTAPSEATTAPPASEMAAPLATLATLDAAELPPRDQIELAFQYGRTTERATTVRTAPLDVKVGDKHGFSIASLDPTADAATRNVVVTATLAIALEHVLVYNQDGLELDPAAVERSAHEFNDRIYPRNRELFGSEWSPGIDGDPRLTILNASIQGAGGYFSAGDEVPRSVYRYSNEREMFYVNVDSYAPGTSAYASTLAHEFQHMIAFNTAKRDATWTNEGLSQLAEELNGYTEDVGSSSIAYIAQPDLQLTDWGNSPSESIGNYAASYLFMSYFYQQYGAPEVLPQLVKNVAGERLQVFADIAKAKNTAITSFNDLYADWATANLLNTASIGDGIFAYTQLAETVQPEPLRAPLDDSVAQYGADYWLAPDGAAERVLRFDGSDTIGVVEAQPDGRAMWWSNRGDNIDTTLERSFDLRAVDSATLQFRLWYQIEEGWDYGFVSVSTDDGAHWATLPGRYTTTDDPQGANYGSGWTGVSGAEPGQPTGADAQPSWVDEQVDLSAYAGKQIRLRFGVINDLGTNRPGLVLDNIRIPEIGFSDDAESDRTSWQASGFVRTGSSLPQQWNVRLARQRGTAITVENVPLDAQNVGEARLAPNERGVLLVMATTPHTTERASYHIELAQP